MTDLMPYGAPPMDGADQGAPAQPQLPPPKPVSAQDVKERWQKADKYLVRDRNNYWLNQSFAVGEQWVKIVGRTLQEVDWLRNDEWQARTTIDKYGPRVRSLVARFVNEDLSFESRADGLDTVSLARKRTREQIVTALHDEDFWEDTREEVLMDVLYGATAAVCVDWDPNGGGDDDAITDPDSGMVYQAGGPELLPLSIADFSVQPGCTDWRQAKWWIRGTSLPPDIVQERYQLPTEPLADARSVLGARHRTLIQDLFGGQQDDLACTAVYVLYEKPCAGYDGRITHVVGSEIVEQTPWPFPFDHLNLYVFRATRMRGRWTGHTLLSTARPIQASYNNVETTIMEHAHKASNARLLLEEGAVADEDQFTDNPGDIVRVSITPGGFGARWMEAPQVPRWLFNESERLEAAMDDVFHTHDVTRGQAPGDRNSGLALSILAEKDDTPLSSIARDQARGWARIAEMVLQLLATRRDGGSVTIYQQGVPTLVNWTPEDIGPNPKVTVPIKTTMPRTKTAVQALITNLLQALPNLAQSLDVKMLGDVLGLEDAEALFQVLNNDEALARWENGMLAQGVPWVPEDFNNHSVHLVEHDRERNTPQYQLWPPQAQQAMEAHIAAHETLNQQKAMEQMQMGLGPDGQPLGLPPGAPAGEVPPGGPNLPPGPPGGPPQTTNGMTP